MTDPLRSLDDFADADVTGALVPITAVRRRARQRVRRARIAAGTGVAALLIAGGTTYAAVAGGTSSISTVDPANQAPAPPPGRSTVPAPPRPPATTTSTGPTRAPATTPSSRERTGPGTSAARPTTTPGSTTLRTTPPAPATPGAGAAPADAAYCGQILRADVARGTLDVRLWTRGAVRLNGATFRLPVSRSAIVEIGFPPSLSVRDFSFGGTDRDSGLGAVTAAVSGPDPITAFDLEISGGQVVLVHSGPGEEGEYFHNCRLGPQS